MLPERKAGHLIEQPLLALIHLVRAVTLQPEAAILHRHAEGVDPARLVLRLHHRLDPRVEACLLHQHLMDAGGSRSTWTARNCWIWLPVTAAPVSSDLPRTPPASAARFCNRLANQATMGKRAVCPAEGILDESSHEVRYTVSRVDTTVTCGPAGVMVTS